MLVINPDECIDCGVCEPECPIDAIVSDMSYNKKDKEVQYASSFVGYFPAEKPKYSCIVVVNNPKNKQVYGGKVAAPIFRELSEKVFSTDFSLQPNINKSDSLMSLPIVKQGKTQEAIYVLNDLEIPLVETKGKWMISTNSNREVNLLLRKIEEDLKKGRIPDLTGINIKDAVYLLESQGLIVSLTGSGSVQNQSISKGMSFKKGQIIHLTLI